MAPADLVQRAKGLLEELARTPRFAGSPEESAARALCRAELERAGFECRELPFDYSQWPGRWGPPIAAAFQALTILAVAHMAVHHGPLSALIVGAALVIALMLASGDAKRRWTAIFPLQRASSTNLEAQRGNPEVWLVAHVDSKSQTVPMLIRIASSIVLAIVTAASFIVILLSLVGVTFAPTVWHGLALAAVFGALPSMFCLVRNGSAGAVDNASGVVAVLTAVRSDSAPRDLGVLITSGEELGLAGARAWVHAHARATSAQPGIRVLNCDTVDDAGAWRCMYTGPRPKRIAAAAETIASVLGVRLTVGRLIPGILADSMAFADLGIEAVTLSRGTLSTLARIHTRRDNSNALTGNGAADAGVLLSALAKELG
ncbi:MAG TPA: M28 family peptidase [Gemmatimonadaceae bacterium]|nr:M28 family peptidase [Gemmatimonadaceae bacterium]